MGNEIIVGMSKVSNQITMPALKPPRLAICGSTGSGKTCMLGNLLLQYFSNESMQGDRAVQVLALDPKLTSLDWLQDRAEVVTEPAMFLPKLRAFSDMVMRRYGEMRDLGIAQLGEQHLDRWPLQILVLEEAMSIAQNPDLPKGADKQIHAIYSGLFTRMRAANAGVIMVSQSFSHEVLPTVARDQLDTRIIMRTSSEDMVKLLADSTECPAHTLAGAGEFFFKSPDTMAWLRGKTWATTENEMREVANLYAADKRDMGLDWEVSNPL